MHTDIAVAPNTREYVPGGHNKQLLGLIELNVFEKVPAGQKVQEDDPAAVEYVPMGQSMQTSTLEPLVTIEYCPARHREQLVDPSTLGEYCPLGQGVHVLMEVAPTAVEYVPGGQGVHLNRSIPEWSAKVPESMVKHFIKSNLCISKEELDCTCRTKRTTLQSRHRSKRP